MALSQNNNHTFVSGELVTSAKLNSTKIIQTDTEAVNDGFTGNPGQLTYDSTNKKLRLHDGTTAGGLEVTPTQGVSLGAGSVNTSALADGAVTEVKLANGSVTSDKLASGAVSLGVGAVTEAMLATGAVTSDKIATGAIASIDDIGDVKTLGTSGGVNHAPSDGDALVWDATHNHWMPGSPFQGGNIGARAILHMVRTVSGGRPTAFSNGPRAYNQASVVEILESNGSPTAIFKFTFSTAIQNPIVMVGTGGYGRVSTSSSANTIYSSADLQIREITVTNDYCLLSIDNLDQRFSTNSNYMPWLEWFAIVF